MLRSKFAPSAAAPDADRSRERFDIQFAKREHAVTEPDRLPQMPAPIGLVGRCRHQLAGEVGDQRQSGALYSSRPQRFEFVENGFGPRRMETVGDVQFPIFDLLPVELL